MPGLAFLRLTSLAFLSLPGLAFLRLTSLAFLSLPGLAFLRLTGLAFLSLPGLAFLGLASLAFLGLPGLALLGLAGLAFLGLSGELLFGLLEVLDGLVGMFPGLADIGILEGSGCLFRGLGRLAHSRGLGVLALGLGNVLLQLSGILGDLGLVLGQARDHLIFHALGVGTFEGLGHLLDPLLLLGQFPHLLSQVTGLPLVLLEQFAKRVGSSIGDLAKIIHHLFLIRLAVGLFFPSLGLVADFGIVGSLGEVLLALGQVGELTNLTSHFDHFGQLVQHALDDPDSLCEFLVRDVCLLDPPGRDIRRADQHGGLRCPRDLAPGKVGQLLGHFQVRLFAFQSLAELLG